MRPLPLATTSLAAVLFCQGPSRFLKPWFSVSLPLWSGKVLQDLLENRFAFVSCHWNYSRISELFVLIWICWCWNKDWGKKTLCFSVFSQAMAGQSCIYTLRKSSSITLDAFSCVCVKFSKFIGHYYPRVITEELYLCIFYMYLHFTFDSILL